MPANLHGIKMGFLNLVFLSFLTFCSVSHIRKERLIAELSQILKSDQELRELFTFSITPERKRQILKAHGITENEFRECGWKLTETNDSLNLVKVERIVKDFGYPGKALIGSDRSTTVWYVVQHSKLDVMQQYCPLIVEVQKKVIWKKSTSR